MFIINAFNNPNWRYKLIWLGVSAGIFLLAWLGSEGGSDNHVLVFSALSTALAASVLTWYAILVASGKLVRAYFAGRDSVVTVVGDMIVVWLVTVATGGSAVWFTGLAWGQGTGLSTLTASGLIVIVFVAAMRTMDLRDETVGATIYKPKNRSAYQPQTDRPVGYPSVGLGNEFVDGDTITIEDVPTKTI